MKGEKVARKADRRETEGEERSKRRMRKREGEKNWEQKREQGGGERATSLK